MLDCLSPAIGDQASGKRAMAWINASIRLDQ